MLFRSTLWYKHRSYTEAAQMKYFWFSSRVVVNFGCRYSWWTTLHSHIPEWNEDMQGPVWICINKALLAGLCPHREQIFVCLPKHHLFWAREPLHILALENLSWNWWCSRVIGCSLVVCPKLTRRHPTSVVPWDPYSWSHSEALCFWDGGNSDKQGWVEGLRCHLNLLQSPPFASPRRKTRDPFGSKC